MNEPGIKTDRPSIEYPDGTKCWCKNGELHRKDGPSIEYPDGTKCWYIDGKYHREDGPAVEHANGTKTYWLNGKMYSFGEWNEKRFWRKLTAKKRRLR